MQPASRQGPGQPYALALSAGEADARVPNLGVEPVRELGHVLLEGGQSHRPQGNAVILSAKA